jgi:hypothetical protein
VSGFGFWWIFVRGASELDEVGDWFWEKDRLASEFEGSATQAEKYGAGIWFVSKIFLPRIFLPSF